MTIEISILISVLSVTFAIFFGISNKRRGDQSDTRREQADMTTFVVKLENINSGVNEIKADLRNVRDEVNKHSERLATVEASAKQAHKRLDALIDHKDRDVD